MANVPNLGKESGSKINPFPPPLLVFPSSQEPHQISKPQRSFPSPAGAAPSGDRPSALRLHDSFFPGAHIGSRVRQQRHPSVSFGSFCLRRPAVRCSSLRRAICTSLLPVASLRRGQHHSSFSSFPGSIFLLGFFCRSSLHSRCSSRLLPFPATFSQGELQEISVKCAQVESGADIQIFLSPCIISVIFL